MNARDYRNQLIALQPPGALPADDDSTWVQLLDALAQQLASVEQRARDVVRKADPRATLELLPEWEETAALPDPCLGTTDQLLQARRAALVNRLSGRGGATVTYFLRRARALGYDDIEIEEVRPTRSGVLRAGQKLAGDEKTVFSWWVRLPVQVTHTFQAGASTSGEKLGYWAPVDLECMLERLKPAHTAIGWQYVT